jgi:hypothetical protein
MSAMNTAAINRCTRSVCTAPAWGAVHNSVTSLRGMCAVVAPHCGGHVGSAKGEVNGRRDRDTAQEQHSSFVQTSRRRGVGRPLLGGGRGGNHGAGIDHLARRVISGRHDLVGKQVCASQGTDASSRVASG